MIEGVYYGGANEEAKAAVAEGRASPREFRWFTRYCGWSAGQLQVTSGPPSFRFLFYYLLFICFHFLACP